MNLHYKLLKAMSSDLEFPGNFSKGVIGVNGQLFKDTITSYKCNIATFIGKIAFILMNLQGEQSKGHKTE